MILLICGSRHWTDVDTIRAWLRRFPAGTIVVHGAARGADTLAAEVACELGFETRAYPADWRAFGLAAGPLRNQRMIDAEHPERGIAFTQALVGTGSGDMVARLVAAGVVCTVVPPGARP